MNIKTSFKAMLAEYEHAIKELRKDGLKDIDKDERRSVKLLYEDYLVWQDKLSTLLRTEVTYVCRTTN